MPSIPGIFAGTNTAMASMHDFMTLATLLSAQSHGECAKSTGPTYLEEAEVEVESWAPTPYWAITSAKYIE